MFLHLGRHFVSCRKKRESKLTAVLAGIIIEGIVAENDPMPDFRRGHSLIKEKQTKQHRIQKQEETQCAILTFLIPFYTWEQMIKHWIFSRASIRFRMESAIILM